MDHTFYTGVWDATVPYQLKVLPKIRDTIEINICFVAMDYHRPIKYN